MAKIIDIYEASRENMEVLKEYLKNSDTHKICFLEEHDMPYAVTGELEEVAIAKVEYINGSVEFTCVKVEEEIPDFESEEELEEWLEEMAEDYDAWIYEESDFCYNTCALAVYEILSNLPIE